MYCLFYDIFIRHIQMYTYLYDVEIALAQGLYKAGSLSYRNPVLAAERTLRQASSENSHSSLPGLGKRLERPGKMVSSRDS